MDTAVTAFSETPDGPEGRTLLDAVYAGGIESALRAARSWGEQGPGDRCQRPRARLRRLDEAPSLNSLLDVVDAQPMNRRYLQVLLTQMYACMTFDAKAAQAVRLIPAK